MSTTKQLKAKEVFEVSNEVMVDETVKQLAEMITTSVDYQTKVNPVFQTIQTKILALLEKENEIENMETKDLFKLLEMSMKAQLQPVETLTKLVQAVTALRDSNELEKKVGALNSIVQTIQEEAKSKVINHVEPMEDLIDDKLVAGDFVNIEDFE